MGRRGLLRVATVVAVLVGLIAPLVPAPPAARATPAGTGFIATDQVGYGANATITATGAIDDITGCPAGGINDSLFASAADVYVVQHNVTFNDGQSIKGLAFGGAPTATIVSDVSGEFISWTIGFTAPGGTLKAGTYSIVLDECQDGIYHAAFDEQFPQSFVVSIPTVVPPPSPAIAQVKADAGIQAANASSASKGFNALMQALNLYSQLSTLSSGVEVISLIAAGDVAEAAGVGASMVLDYSISASENALANKLKANAQQAAVFAMANMARNYQEIQADPPDPNYKQVTVVGPQTVVQPQSADPVVQASATLGTAANTEQALEQALLDALQRYEGAANAGDGAWALIHAREVQQYATLLAGSLSTTSQALTQTAHAVTTDPAPLNNTLQFLEAIRSDVAANGFSPAEQQALVAAGYTPSQITALGNSFINENFTVTQAQVAGELQAIATEDTTEASDLTAFASGMQSNITTLQNDSSVIDDAPIASAGGPYSGAQGTPITLDASASTSGALGSPIVSYQWDTQGTGTFATSGKTVSVTYPFAFTGMVGVKVTNADGVSSVAYAPIGIGATNQPPSITAFSPNADLVTNVSVGSSQAFSVTTHDVENDPTLVQWTVDGNAAGQGGSFSYSPGAADEGSHLLVAQASDANLLGSPATAQAWLVAVCPVPAPPGQPLNVGATPGNAQATVTWSPPAESCGNAVTGYVVVASTGQSATLPGTATGVNFLGLPNGTPVSFTVAALNAIGAGQPSNPSPTVTPTGAPPPPPGLLTLTTIASGFPSPIGIDWYEPANEVIMSVNYGGGQPNNFDLVDANGNFSPFSTVKGLGDEVYIAAIRTSSCAGGFTPGDVYFGTGTGGVIARLTNNGTVFQNPWVTLPGERSTLRGGVFQDVYCVAGGDLIATTEGGDVWRVTSAGVATKVAGGFGASWLEGPTTVPNDPTRYGPWAGKIIASDESNGAVWSIDPTTGATAKWTGGGDWGSAEGVHIVPPNENFFGVDYGSGKLKGLPASDFTGMVGDVLLFTEFPGRLVDITWNATTSSFVSHDILKTNASQWEGTAFAGAALPGVAGTSGLSCIASTSTAPLGSLVKLSSQLVNVATSGGVSVSFIDSGANPQSATVAADASGIATVNLAGSAAGSDTIVATATVGGQTLTSNPCDVQWTGTPPAVLTYTGPTSGDYGDSVTLSAHLVDGSGNPLSGDAIAFDLGTQSCTGTTDGSGNASCAITVNQPVGPITVRATYTQLSGWYATASTGFSITTEETVLTYTGPSALDYHDAATVSATLTSDDNVQLGNQSVTFTLNGAETCTGTTAADGSVSCGLTPAEAAAGYPLAISYGGNAAYKPASISPSVTVQLEQTTLGIVSASALTVDHAIVMAKLLEDGDSTMPLVGKTVQFIATPTGGGSPITGSGTVLSDGVAAAKLALGTGTYTLVATFTSDGFYAAAGDSGPLTVAGQHQTQLTYNGATTGDFNDALTLSATLTDVTTSPPSPVAGKTVSFTLGSGAGAPTCTGTTDASGKASCSVTPSQHPAGVSVAVSFAGDNAYLSSSTTASVQVTVEDTKLTTAASYTQDYHDPLTVSATLIDPTDSTPIAGKPVTFTMTGTGAVAGEGCTATTDLSGVASCSFTPAEAAGSYTLAVGFAGDTDYQAASTSAPVTVTLEQTALSITSSTTLPTGKVTVAAQLLEDGSASTPLAGRTVSFTATPNGGGTPVIASGTTDASGHASTTLNLSSGDYTLAARFAGDAYEQPADATTQAHLYVYQPSQFVIWGGNPPGTATNPNVTVGNDYTFWGPAWADQITGGHYQGTPAFKGFATSVTGSSWTARPGHGGNPPTSVARYISVIVATTITKSGSTVSGNVAEVVVLRVDDPDRYAPDPGHQATGVLMAVVH
ncbi:MAG TPA: fibronectin type III domain-containing protein [Thermomicrobiaceae bacterium]|nr:fibronectin type III domain-containing protein [Thermomicrobiaceae bacterium]